MTFNAAIPLASDSPATFPAQNQTNMARLQTIVGGDHQFNLSAAANDGYHNLIHLTQQAPSGTLSGTGRAYAKSSAGRIHYFYMDDTGVGYQITPTLPIRAAVNFSGQGSTTIRSQYNVSSVTYIATGQYQINFTTAMPDNNYVVQATGMRNGSQNFVIGCVQSNDLYSSSVSTASVIVNFFNDDGSFRDVLMGNITVFSVT